MNPSRSNANDVNTSFVLIGPLPTMEPGERPRYFPESEIAHENYTARRSANAHEDSRVYHVVDLTGDVAGFIVYRIAREEGKASTRIFNDIEYMYIAPRFRWFGLSDLLLEPILQDMQVVLRHATGDGRKPIVRIYSASHPEGMCGKQALITLERRLLELAMRYRRVQLTGNYVGHIATTRLSSWEPLQASN